MWDDKLTKWHVLSPRLYVVIINKETRFIEKCQC